LVDERWFHGCSACGKCCNSPPLASLPELLHHQARFIGCLSIRRMRRVRAGDRLPGARSADADDERAWRELASSLFLPGPLTGEHDFFLFTQAFGYASQPSCPALEPASGRCRIHDDNKPVTCSVVPLEATWPDELQGAILAARHAEADFVGADCISPTRTTLPLVTRRREVVSQEARTLLTRRRSDLISERRIWGDRVARLFGPELFARPERLRDIPEDGALTLSIVPVLATLAEVSARSHARIRDYISVQIELIERTLAEALARKNAADRADTATLRAFLNANRTLDGQLARGPLTSSPVSVEQARSIEQWLSLT